MPIATRILPSAYYDSVTLMLVARGLLAMPGVQDAAVVMGTPANLALMRDAGLLTAQAQAATSNDLVVAVLAAGDDEAAAALAAVDGLLAADKGGKQADGAAPRPRSLRAAVRQVPGANLARISVAGRYAAREARVALAKGLHVMLFSDNVSLEDEIALKTLAGNRGLLCMGPDAGTAIVAARARAEAAGRYLPVVTFVCGTEDDPQRLSEQEAKLRAAGALVTASNAQAARVAALILAGRP